jgi:carbon-monoxide dehydrogenase medium subunit
VEAAMFPNIDDYHRPETVDSAVDLMAENPEDRVVLAGGTTLIPQEITEYSEVVDIQSIGYEGIDSSGDSIQIGALTPISQLQKSSGLRDRDLDVLMEAARDKRSQLKRNQATVGGELASADPRAEIPTVLLALGAELTVQGTDGTRTLPLDDLYDGSGSLTLEDSEIITSVEFEAPGDDERLFYDRLSRTENDISLVNCAFRGRYTGDGYENVRVAAGAVDEATVRLPEVEQFVEDLQRWSPDAEDELDQILEESVHPPDDFRASSDYRRTVLGVYIKRAVTGQDPANPKSNGEIDL